MGKNKKQPTYEVGQEVYCPFGGQIKKAIYDGKASVTFHRVKFKAFNSDVEFVSDEPLDVAMFMLKKAKENFVFSKKGFKDRKKLIFKSLKENYLNQRKEAQNGESI